MGSQPNLEVDLSKYDNSWYYPGSRFKRLTWYFCNLIFLNNSWFLISSIKIFILRCYGAKIGKNVIIKPNINVKYPWFLTIGDNSWIGEGVWIDCLASVIIEDNVCISQGAFILSGNHNFKKSTFDLIVKPIEIKKGSWIGAKSIVTQGLTVGSYAVLTAGSVVSHSMDPYGIYKGVPATKVGERQINI